MYKNIQVSSTKNWYDNYSKGCVRSTT